MPSRKDNGNDEAKENRCASVLWLLVSSVSFSLQACLVRWLTQKGIGTFQLLLLRGSCQGLGCCLWLRGQGLETWLGTTPREWIALFLRAVLGYSALCFGFIAISLMTLADSQILGQTGPIFAVALRCSLLQEAWQSWDLLSASTALLGMGFLVVPVSPVTHFALFRHSLGVLCGLLASTSMGSAEVLVIYWLGRVKVTWSSVLLAQALGQLIISPFAVAVSGEPLRLFTRQQLGVALLLSLLGFGSQIAWIKGVGGSGPSQANLSWTSVVWYSLCPMLAMLWQRFVFQDPLPWTSFAGFGCLFLALVVERAQLWSMPKYTQVARNEEPQNEEGSPVTVECMGFEEVSVLGKRSFFDEGPGQDREDQMVETLQSDGFSRRQAELALADVQWSSAEEALDVLLDVKFQLAANGKPLDPSLPAVPEVAEVPETAGGLQPL